jgi:hypothetical protein
VDCGGTQPILPPEIHQFFLPPRSTGDVKQCCYRPAVLGCAKVYYSDTKSGVECTEEVSLLALLAPNARTAPWDEATALELTEDELDKEPAKDALFASLPAVASKAKSYDTWKKGLTDAIYRTRKLTLFSSAALGQVSRVDESERQFRIRLQQAAREERDANLQKLRLKFAPKIAALEDRIRRAQQAVERESSQATQSKLQTLVSFGSTLVGAIFGRKKLSASTIGKATTAARGAGRSMKDADDVVRAQENVQALEEQLAALETEFKTAAGEIADRINPATEELESITVKPKKTNIAVNLVALTWAPYRQDSSGKYVSLWE